ncbi:MAG: helix-turn-helix transcriptional regulator [Protaetiibacter sp.]
MGAPAHAGNLRGRSKIDCGDIYVHVYASGELVAVDVEDEVAVALIPSVPMRHWHSGMRRRPPIVIDARAGVPSVVAHLIETLARESTISAQRNSPARLAQHVVGLISLACNEVLDGSDSEVPDLLHQAIEHIDRNLADMSLTPNRVAEAVCVSTRTLHRLFEREGLTVSAWIRQRRLENCRDELADPRMQHYPVNAIAARWGLSDAAHFSRLFKAAFGMSPRAFRADLEARSQEAAQWRELRSA